MCPPNGAHFLNILTKYNEERATAWHPRMDKVESATRELIKAERATRVVKIMYNCTQTYIQRRLESPKIKHM